MDKPDAILITVATDGRVRIDGVETADFEQLSSRLKAIGDSTPQPGIRFQAEPGAPYEEVGKVIYRACAFGIDKIDVTSQ